VVGDAEQTIYSFRGSDIDIFLGFPDQWKHSQSITLTQNYRSTKNILGAASAVISKNTYETRVVRAIELWTKNEDGDPVMVHETPDEDEEAHWIAKNIERRIENIGKKDIAVLYRTNAQSRALETALLSHALPYRIFGGLRFYERREIKDIIAALRYSLHQNDIVSRDRLIRTFPKKIHIPLMEVLRKNEGAAPLQLIELFLETSHYVEYLERQFLNAMSRIENIQELISFASTNTDLALFLERITLLEAADYGQKTWSTFSKK